jgi:hypothetical protein
VVGLGGIVVVAGLVVNLAAGGLGGSPAAPASPPPAVYSATESPTAAPTADLMAAAASRFREIETAYVEAYTARHDKLPASGYFASYAQARSYYRAEVKNLGKFGTNVEEMMFPAEVMPDVSVLLKRISELAGLMTKLAATKDETVGWKINEKIMSARTKMNATRVVVGEDLGLTYSAGLALTPTPTPKPTLKTTPKPSQVARYDPAAAERYIADAQYTYGVAMRQNLNIVAQAGFFAGGGGEAGYFRVKEQYEIAAGNIRTLVNDHLRLMKLTPAAPCYRDAYATDRAIAAQYLEAAKYLLRYGADTSDGFVMTPWEPIIAEAEKARVQFYAHIADYFSGCH